MESVINWWDAIGCFRILPEALSAEQLGQDPDVQALDRIIADGGEVMLRILESVSSTDSLRKAAHRVFLHHNSVASRVEKAEAVLGFSVTEPYGKNRLLLALVLRRLRESALKFPA
jgi:sugar diacid utilization regulator